MYGYKEYICYVYRACLFSKSSLARLQEFWNSSICLYEIKRKKSVQIHLTGSFTCPGPSGSGKRRALCLAELLCLKWGLDLVEMRNVPCYFGCRHPCPHKVEIINGSTRIIDFKRLPMSPYRDGSSTIADISLKSWQDTLLDLYLFGPFAWQWREIWIKIWQFSLMKMHFKISAILSRPQYV